MELEYSQETKANEIHRVIKQFERMFREEFGKCAIKPCGHCGGRGVDKHHMNDFCENCHGIGFMGFKKMFGEHICRSCNGVMCQKCQNRGIVDWISHAMGSDISTKGVD